MRKDFPGEISNLEEALLNYIGENDLSLMKTEFPDKNKYLTEKMHIHMKYINTLDDYKKLDNNLKKQDFFCKLKSDYPSDEEIELTKGIIKFFNIKNGEELTQLF